jgi:hypothetical protein
MRLMPLRKNDHLLSVLALVIFASLTTLQAQPYQRKPEATPDEPLAGETQSLWNAYERAVFDSSVYQRWNVRPLRPLTADDRGQMIVATITNKTGNAGETLTVGPHGLWVTGVPEIQTICRGFHGDIAMQVRQLLGLPPDADIPNVLTLSVGKDDLFRPSPDDSISTRFPCKNLTDAASQPDCGNVFPSTTSPSHYQWIAVESFYLHAIPNGYPWTHLGYTYNWAPGADRYGASEYVIRGNAKALIVESTTTLRYCAPPIP